MNNTDDLLREGCAQLGIACTERQVGAFRQYREELKRWNRAHSLTGIRTDRDIVVKHFLDSLLFLNMLPQDVCSVADVGSGAGFPGIPIKIMRPDLTVYLVEPTKKKAVFLRHICHLLGLQNVEVLDRRAEELQGLMVDVIVTRALFRTAEFIKKTRHLLNPGGVFVLSKGRRVSEELKGASEISLKVIPAKLPFGDAERQMVIITP